jgi:glucokinase
MGVSAIGVDIGGTKIAAGIVTAAGEVLSPRTVPTPLAEGPQAVMQAVIGQVNALKQEAPDVQAVGIGTAGLVDSARGVIVHANPNLPGWTGMPLGATVSATTNLPVYVDNDVNALAIGEGRFGAGQDFREVVYVAVGTGIGGALVCGGEIWRGIHFSAGEVRYLVAGWDEQGGPIILEDYASGPAMEKQYQKLSGSSEHLSLRQITERAHAGDALAVRVIESGARILGHVLGPFVGILDVEMLIIGGGVPNVGDLWWNAFEGALRQNDLIQLQNLRVAAASSSTHAGLIGAGAIALNTLDTRLK